MSKSELKETLDSIARSALSAVDPFRAVGRFVRMEGRSLCVDGREYPIDRFRRIFLIGAGKAGVPMAKAVEDILGDRLEKGLVVVRRGGDLSGLEKTEVLESSHPVPDEAGVRASEKLISFLDSRIRTEDLLLVLISGGGSALLPAPVPQISLQEKQQTTRALLLSGASIHDMNTIRKHLSRLKGGRFLEHTRGCLVHSLILSDVVGDDLATIASGPTAPDPTTFDDCLEILSNYGIRDEVPPRVLEYLGSGASGGIFQGQKVGETLKPGDERFDRVTNTIIASNVHALQAAAAKAEETGYRPLILSSSLTGSAAAVADFLLAIAREIVKTGNPAPPPCCIISGGETTVKVTGSGTGGRNQELVLHFLHRMSNWGERGLLFASIGSDGIDGPTDAAGAWVCPADARRAREKGLSIPDFLADNDSYHFFQKLGNLIITGETRTNVMDFQILLVP